MAFLGISLLILLLVLIALGTAALHAMRLLSDTRRVRFHE